MSTFANFKIHPVAAIFPMIARDSRAWNNLVDDIQTSGQIEPTVWDGDVLIDGRNRELACEQLGIKPKRIEWSTMGVKISVGAWILAKNLSRRQLTPDQVAVVYTEYNALTLRLYADKNKEQGQLAGKAKDGTPVRADGTSVNTDSYSPKPKRDAKEMNARSTVGKIAAEANVSHHKAAQAVELEKAAQSDPEAKRALEEVKAGTVKLKDAVKKVRKPKAVDHPKHQKPAKYSFEHWREQHSQAASVAWAKCPIEARDGYRTEMHKIIDDLE